MEIELAQLKALLDGCMSGNAQMQKQLYVQYYSVFMRIGVRYAACTEDAEQWVHDGFLRVFQNLAQYGYQGSFEGWLKKIMTRVCLDHLRAQNTKKNEVEKGTLFNIEESKAAQQIGVCNLIQEKMGVEEVLYVLRKIPDRQRAVFNLYVFEEYSHKEIAKELNISEANSHWLLHQAKKNLKMFIKTKSNIAI